MKAKPIVDWDIDEASYVGDERDGVYYQVAEKTWGPRKDRGFYVTVMVDCDSSGFCQEIFTEQGPMETRQAAEDFGHNRATDWCLENGVHYEGEPNLDLPIEQVPGKPQEVADALMDLLTEFYPVGRVNGAQIFEMLDALAIVTAGVIAQTGDHRPDFDKHFHSQLAGENLRNMGIDPDKEEE